MIAQGIEAENASYSFKNNLELQVFELQTEAKPWYTRMDYRYAVCL
ncbi:hypothetical protein [Faecalimonas umbilicata]